MIPVTYIRLSAVHAVIFEMNGAMLHNLSQFILWKESLQDSKYKPCIDRRTQANRAFNVIPVTYIRLSAVHAVIFEMNGAMQHDP